MTALPCRPGSPSSHMVCTCGTTVIFPQGIDARTCWNCGIVHRLQSDPKHPYLPEQSPASAAANSAQSQIDKPSSGSYMSPGLVMWVLLVASFAMNGLLLAGAFPPILNSTKADTGSGATSQKMPNALAPDSDGDGIPDHHDFCPNLKCSPGDLSCPPSGWLSGRATDFDADGCADGTEDNDKDNDGIIDAQDGCPFTPQKYAFVSNTYSDFDRDGCADGFEDTDDDGDAVPNFIDSCPRTAPWDQSDNSGCSNIQKERPETLDFHRLVTAQSMASATLGEGPSAELKEEKPTRIQEWLDILQGSVLEIIVGAVLSAVLGKAYDAYTKLHEQLPGHSGGSVQRLSSGMVEGLCSVRQKSSSCIGNLRPQTLAGFFTSWASFKQFLQLHIFRIAGYLFVVYVSRYHRDCFTVEAVQSGLSSGALWLSSCLESFASSVSSV